MVAARKHPRLLTTNQRSRRDPHTGSALELTGLTKHFDGIKALTDVSLRVDRNEILGLIGPNGSGKTTLLNVVSGTFPATAGKVLLDGEVLTGASAHEAARRGVARTFQNIRLFGGLSVEANVAVSALAKGARRPEAEAATFQALEEVGLIDAASTRASTLAYGDQRRLEIARALAGDPAVLLLDEPAAGLNEQESDDLLSLIHTIRDNRACATVVVEHDMRLIMRLCDRIHVLDAGRTLFEGNPAQVRASEEVAEAYLGSKRGGGA
jgi:branched-chain amino acid transport system ATP-binding protein